jgi:TorA maturation chaperone TorD
MSIEKKEHVMRLLAACFCEPEVKMYKEEAFFQNLRESLSSFCNEAVAHVDLMEKSVQQYSEEELLVEYARLFVGPYALIAAPYGSVYLDDGRVMGDSTMEVIQWYEQEGLVRGKDCRDIPDHIAVELEFMSFLIRKEIDATTSKDQQAAEDYANKQKKFTNSLLRSWVPQFCEQIRTSTKSDYYRAVADCTQATLSAL